MVSSDKGTSPWLEVLTYYYFPLKERKVEEALATIDDAHLFRKVALPHLTPQKMQGFMNYLVMTFVAIMAIILAVVLLSRRPRQVGCLVVSQMFLREGPRHTLTPKKRAPFFERM